jgi:hypothetical protein
LFLAAELVAARSLWVIVDLDIVVHDYLTRTSWSAKIMYHISYRIAHGVQSRRLDCTGAILVRKTGHPNG